MHHSIVSVSPFTMSLMVSPKHPVESGADDVDETVRDRNKNTSLHQSLLVKQKWCRHELNVDALSYRLEDVCRPAPQGVLFLLFLAVKDGRNADIEDKREDAAGNDDDTTPEQRDSDVTEH